MSETLGFRSRNSASQAKFISQLERQFTTITQLLYTTSVPGPLLDRQVLPYIANDIVFKDPWQEGGSKQLYRIGMKGIQLDIYINLIEKFYLKKVFIICFILHLIHFN